MHRRNYLKTMALGTLSTGLMLDSCKPEASSPMTTGSNLPVSKRGLDASTSVVRVDMELYFEAADNMYHKANNPDGAFPLNVAENRMNWPMLRTQIEKMEHKHPMEDWVANYTSAVGALSFRKVMADFLSKFLTHCPIDPDQLCLSPGATAVIDVTAWILGQPGDVVVIPAPCYPVYKQDIGNRSGLERYDLVTHHDLSEIKNGPPLSIQHLEDALREIQSQGKQFKILIITNPDNPTGGMYSREQLTAYADWCLSHNIHLIVNEIYGLSLIDTAHPELMTDYTTDVRFYSFANIIQEKKSDFLHQWYALSKDFGVSGFRVGLVYSLNKTFLTAYNNLNGPTMVSNYTQWIFEKALNDHAFVEAYIKANQQLLTENYVTVVRQLRKLGISYTPARGSLFAWLDLSEFLENNTQEAETKFWMELYKQSGVLLTPGNGFGHTKRGQFRLVFSYVMKEDLEVAMGRLTKFVESKRA